MKETQAIPTCHSTERTTYTALVMPFRPGSHTHTHKTVPILHSDCINWEHTETDHSEYEASCMWKYNCKTIFDIFSSSRNHVCTVLFFAFYTLNFKGPQACHIQNTQSLEVTGQHISYQVSS